MVRFELTTSSFVGLRAIQLRHTARTYGTGRRFRNVELRKRLINLNCAFDFN